MKRKVISVLLASTMVFSLAACGGSGDDGSKDQGAAKEDIATDDGAKEDGGEEKLTVWCWDKNFNMYAIDKAAELYQKDHPGFTVEQQEIRYPDIEVNITNAAAAGDLSTLPDIVLMQDNSIQKYMSLYPDVFTDLTDSGIDFSQFAEAKVAYSKVDGKNYAVPFDNGTAICGLRTDMLEQAGLTVEDFTDITWTQFIENGEKVKEATGNPMLTGVSSEPDLIMLMLQSAGASLFNEDGSLNIVGNEALKESMEVYQKLVEKGILAEVTSNDQNVAALNGSTVAGVIDGCWKMASVTPAEDQSGKWAITNMPRLETVDGATNYSNNGGSSWMITSNCKNVDLAVDFLNSSFAGSTDFYDTLLEKGAIATWQPARDTDAYGQAVEFWGGEPVYSKLVEFAGKTPSNITGPYYYDARNAIGAALGQIIQQGEDIDTALQSVQEEVEFTMGG